ncbi:uncharacterized protein BDV14DRAFT_88363 [Aspergillus stella-maris]|uniref:uncharacterized protein n=1 Tax=Aspergillus stella-maris TaxID=1810926 RepID=UPI003CCDDE0E
MLHPGTGHSHKRRRDRALETLTCRGKTVECVLTFDFWQSATSRQPHRRGTSSDKAAVSIYSWPVRFLNWFHYPRQVLLSLIHTRAKVVLPGFGSHDESLPCICWVLLARRHLKALFIQVTGRAAAQGTVHIPPLPDKHEIDCQLLTDPGICCWRPAQKL